MNFTVDVGGQAKNETTQQKEVGRPTMQLAKLSKSAR